MLPYVFGFPTYSLCLIAALLLALPVFFHRLDPSLRKKAVPFLFAAAFGALLGAKLLYLAALPDDVSPLHAFFTGFVFHGGLIGGVLAGLLAAHFLHLPVLRLADASAPALALGHALGRLGCFCAGCCYGLPLAQPWGILLPHAIGGAPRDIPLFPIQLAEAVCNLLLGLRLLRRPRQHREDGVTAALYCLAYSLLRFLLEFLRGDRIRGFAAGFSTGQWMSAVLFLVGLALLARTSSAVFSLRGTFLVIDYRFFGGLLPIRFTARLFRDKTGTFQLNCTLFGRPLPTKRPGGSGFRLPESFVPFSLHVRELSVCAALGLCEDAAATALLCGLLSAALKGFAAYLSARESVPPNLRLRVTPLYNQTALRLEARAHLAFRTADALRTLMHLWLSRRRAAKHAA